MVMDQNRGTVSAHMQDCMFEACLSPTFGWLSPARVSFSRDLPPHELQSVEEIDGMNIAISKDCLPPKAKDRLAMDSISDFEFAMAMVEGDRTGEHGIHMLAADELFFKGKLLPLYVPEYLSDGAEQRRSVWQHPERKATHRCSESDMNLMSLSSSLSSSSSRSCVPLRHGALESTEAKDFMKTPPKPLKCTSKLRKLLGLKWSKTGLHSTSTLPNTSSNGESKQRKPSTEAIPTFQTFDRAKLPFCKSEESKRKVPKGGSSTLEPLLFNVCNATVSDTRPSIGCPVISLSPQRQCHNRQASREKPPVYSASPSPTSLCSQITRMQRKNRVCDHGDDAFTKVPSLQQLRVLTEAKSTDNYMSMRALTPCRKGWIKEELKPAVYRAVRRPSWQGFAHYGGIDESSPARRSSDATSPAASSGQWSPSRDSWGALMSGYSTACSSCLGSPGRHSTSGVTPCYSPGRLSSGIEQLSLSAFDTGHERSIRAQSLERTCINPKSLQRKHDQMKALRQRDGWRPGIERSLSYNNMSSGRVPPVLNVPRVCTLNRSSRSSSHGLTHSNRKNGGGGLGLGHLFSAKPHLSKNPASSRRH